MNCLRNRAIFSLSSIVAATLSVFSLTGCTGFGAASFPDASANAKTPIGTIQGSNFGGHAPLTNAHIYLVEPGTGGYGSVVKGLLTATSANPSFPTTKNGSWGTGPTASDNFVPATDSVGNPFYGVTTDSTGSFQISGDYTCDPGSPVYLIGYGGTPSYPSTVNTFNISSVDVVGTASPYTYTFTISNPPENAYIGESATVTGITGTTFTYLGTGVQAANLTTTTFELTSSTGTAGTHAQTGASVTFSPTFNPSAVNMAVLGNCPSTGVANFGSTSNSPIKYVYMNEVSTTAAAYALAGFVDPTKTSQTGLDEFHIGYANTTQALKGIQNAILTAQNLYDITGSDISTTYAGEGHIARATTVGSNATTTGTVPQSLIDTIGDILAACVDSNNTIVITGTTGTSPVTDTTSGTLSAQCQTLFQYATDNGIHDTTTYNATLPATGHQPYNIAQAALSMARFPQGFGIGTTTSAGVQSTTSAQSVTNGAAYVAALYALPTGNPPFSPSLLSSAAPDSFAIPITYTNSTMLTPYRDAIDSQGNVWVVGNGQNYALKFNNLGVQQYALTGVDSGVSVAIDQSDNAWVTSNTNSTVQEFSSTGSTLQTGLAPTGIDAPYAIAVDGGNNVWVGNETGDALIKMTNAGVLTTSFTNTAITTVEGMAFDNTGAVWIAQFTGTKVAKINAADNAVTYNPTGNGLDVTARVVVDSSNNAWFESSGNATLEELSSTDTVLSGTTGYTVTGGAGTNPEGLGIDGNDNLYECFAGTTAATSAVAKFTNAGKYVLNLTTGQNGSRGCQIDPSGNLWVVENQIPSMIEYVGIATPVVTPTSIGVKNSTLGTKP